MRGAIDRVLASGWFVLGHEVEAFEAEFAQACGARHAVGVASGTDAIALTLRALGIGPGDEVIVPALTAAYTGLAVMMAGARPVFADVDPEHLTIDPSACVAAMTSRTRAIVPVHLYGCPADLAALLDVSARHGVSLVEDCCQAHAAACDGVAVATAAAAGAFSFYPTKNLGALGDGGAVVTNDAALADRVRRLHNGGQIDRDHHADPGVNSRRDELQAAVLRERLPLLAGWTSRRRILAREYRRSLAGSVATPVSERDPGHVYHLFPVRVERRNDVRAHLREKGIETLVHYPVPLPEQQAFAEAVPAHCPVAARAASELLSLLLHPHLVEANVTRVTDAIRSFSAECPAVPLRFCGPCFCARLSC